MANFAFEATRDRNGDQFTYVGNLGIDESRRGTYSVEMYEGAVRAPGWYGAAGPGNGPAGGGGGAPHDSGADDDDDGGQEEDSRQEDDDASPPRRLVPWVGSIPINTEDSPLPRLVPWRRGSDSSSLVALGDALDRSLKGVTSNEPGVLALPKTKSGAGLIREEDELVDVETDGDVLEPEPVKEDEGEDSPSDWAGIYQLVTDLETVADNLGSIAAILEGEDLGGVEEPVPEEIVLPGYPTLAGLGGAGSMQVDRVNPFDANPFNTSKRRKLSSKKRRRARKNKTSTPRARDARTPMYPIPVPAVAMPAVPHNSDEDSGRGDSLNFGFISPLSELDCAGNEVPIEYAQFACDCSYHCGDADCLAPPHPDDRIVTVGTDSEDGAGEPRTQLGQDTE